MIHGWLVGLGIALGFMLFMFFVFLVAEAADRLVNWVWNKFSDWVLRHSDKS